MTSVGRITFALARDGAFPYSDLISKISVHMKSPVNAIIFVALCDTGLQLIPLDTTNGSVAFNAIIGLCVLGFQLSYALPIFFKLIFPQPTFPRTAMDLGEGGALPCCILLASVSRCSSSFKQAPCPFRSVFWGALGCSAPRVCCSYPSRGLQVPPHSCLSTSVVMH